MSKNSPETPYTLALKTALNILGRKSVSENEMREKLQTISFHKNFTEETINGVIDYLIERNYLNDSKLCDCLFDKLSQSGKYGYKLTAFKLKERGLSSEMIAAKMKEFDFEAEAQQAVDLAEKRYGHEEKTGVVISKIARYLTGRGFSSYSVVKAVKAFENKVDLV